NEDVGVELMNALEEKQEALAEGRQEGLAEGLVKGEQRNARKIARNLLQMGMDVKTIAEITGLSEKEVRELQQ
ncbi:MAG: hypothetical protein Q4C25_09680, partial [Bacillota bacterium]|nr:hypothetical protein [Bacillota bacterium]